MPKKRKTFVILDVKQHHQRIFSQTSVCISMRWPKIEFTHLYTTTEKIPLVIFPYCATPTKRIAKEKHENENPAD